MKNLMLTARLKGRGALWVRVKPGKNGRLSWATWAASDLAFINI